MSWPPEGGSVPPPGGGANVGGGAASPVLGSVRLCDHQDGCATCTVDCD